MNKNEQIVEKAASILARAKSARLQGDISEYLHALRVVEGLAQEIIDECENLVTTARSSR